MNHINGFDKRFAEALAEAPEVPDCYQEILRRIKRGNATIRATWAIAALLVISFTSFLFIGNHAHESVPSEVAQELQSIDKHVSGDDIREELVSCSLTGEDSF
jgi:hypothetical protein